MDFEKDSRKLSEFYEIEEWLGGGNRCLLLRTMQTILGVQIYNSATALTGDDIIGMWSTIQEQFLPSKLLKLSANNGLGFIIQLLGYGPDGMTPYIWGTFRAKELLKSGKSLGQLIADYVRLNN